MTSSFLCFCCLLVQWSSAALFTTSLTLLWHKTDSAKPCFSVYGFPAGEGGGTARLRRAEPSCPLPKRRPVSLAPCTSCSSAAGRQQGQTAELPPLQLSVGCGEAQSSSAAHGGALSRQISSGLWAVPPPVIQNAGHKTSNLLANAAERALYSESRPRVHVLKYSGAEEL